MARLQNCALLISASITLLGHEYLAEYFDCVQDTGLEGPGCGCVLPPRFCRPQRICVGACKKCETVSPSLCHPAAELVAVLPNLCFEREAIVRLGNTHVSMVPFEGLVLGFE